MTELTEAEIERLCDAVEDSDAEYRVEVRVARVVVAIIDARLAPIRALAEKFDGHAIGRDFFGNPLDSWVPVSRLRMALDGPSADLTASQPHDGTGSHGDSERAGEGDVCPMCEAGAWCPAHEDDDLRSCGCCDGSDE